MEEIIINLTSFVKSKLFELSIYLKMQSKNALVYSFFVQHSNNNQV